MTLQEMINETCKRMKYYSDKAAIMHDRFCNYQNEGLLTAAYTAYTWYVEYSNYQAHYQNLLTQLTKIQKKYCPAVIQLAKNISRRI